jgi:hypothetical protein
MRASSGQVLGVRHWPGAAVWAAVLLGLCVGRALPQDKGLLGGAEQAALEIADVRGRALVLADLAAAWSASDPAAAQRAVAEALKAVEAVGNDLDRIRARQGVALRTWRWEEGPARLGLTQAAAAARALPYPAQRAVALREMGAGLLALDPDLARGLLDQALMAARSVESPPLRVAALRDLAAAVAPLDPTRGHALFREASRLLAATASEGAGGQLAGAELAVAWVASEPEAALAVARRLTDPSVRQDCYQRLCEALAPTDPDGALQVAGLQVGKQARSLALATVAAHLPAGRAELAATLARSALVLGAAGEGEERAALQGQAALALAAADPDAALKLARAIADEDTRVATQGELAVRLAQSRPADALALAAEIADAREREQCLARLLPLLDEPHRDAAVAAARGLRDPRLRATTLMALARR